MAFTENLDLFLLDFGLPVTAGAVTGIGILDMPTQVVADGMVLSSDYTLTAKAADFGGLLYGDGVTVDGVNYQVREVRKLDDGQMCEISLTKLAPDAVAPGGQPREFGMSDLADVDTAGVTAGDQLRYDGTNWVDVPTVKSITVAQPVIGDEFTLVYTEAPITLSEVRALVRGASPSVTYEIRYAADRSAAGTLAIAPTTVTNTTTGALATIQNQPIPADRYVWLAITAVSGVVGELNVSIEL